MAKNTKDSNPQTISNVEQTLTRTEQFLEDNYRVLLTGLGIIVVIVGLIWLGKFYLSKRNDEAQSQIYQAEKYLEKRREQGFTVIQAVILAELDGLHTPNRNGDLPLHGDDPRKPNEKYFQFVDSIINLAATKGIFIGLLPTWGDKVDLASWGKGPRIFTPENAAQYGRYLGNRYKGFPNIIWINGGDRSAGPVPVTFALAAPATLFMTALPVAGALATFGVLFPCGSRIRGHGRFSNGCAENQAAQYEKRELHKSSAEPHAIPSRQTTQRRYSGLHFCQQGWPLHPPIPFCLLQPPMPSCLKQPPSILKHSPSRLPLSGKPL